jgi:hypothetical protein
MVRILKHVVHALMFYTKQKASFVPCMLHVLNHAVHVLNVFLDTTKSLTCSSSLTWDLSPPPLQGSRIIVLVLLPFQHKLNYFSFCRAFEKKNSLFVQKK